MGHLLSILSGPTMLTLSPLQVVCCHQIPPVTPVGGPAVPLEAYMFKSLTYPFSPGLVPPYTGGLPSRRLLVPSRYAVPGLLNLTGLHERLYS